MKIVLLGSPGSGKGSLATKLIEKYHFQTIATGDIFRNEISNNTKLGQQAKALIAEGKLIPDTITNELVKNVLIEKGKVRPGILLDGYPRTINQAETLDANVASLSSQIDYAIYIKVEEKITIERIINRRICPECHQVYNMLFAKPLAPGKCDNCNTLLIHRSDDSLIAIKKRLLSYYKNTEPLIKYYQAQNKLITIDGNTTVANSLSGLQKIIGSRLKHDD